MITILAMVRKLTRSFLPDEHLVNSLPCKIAAKLPPLRANS
jgi:hypothetical protein